MSKMDVDDVVDLSMGRDSMTLTQETVRDLQALSQNSGLTITPAPAATAAAAVAAAANNNSNSNNETYSRRVLRPRTEPKSYAEVPDIVLLPAKLNGRQQNGNIDSESDDEEMPPIIAIKELSAAEIWERERGLRKLREELRNEETKLVLLKKLKQSQLTLKENLIVTPALSNPMLDIPVALTKGSLSVTPAPMPPHSAHKSSRSSSSTASYQISRADPPSRQSHLPPPTRSSLPGGATLTAGGPPRSSFGQSRAGSNLTITPSVTITPTSAPSSGSKRSLNLMDNGNKMGATQISSSVSITPAPPMMQSNNDQINSKLMADRSSSREDTQTPAQRQAAAKLALRKQLEKTLLQIPPPKPPPPEMNFIPNPSNTEFVYLLGLETAVDYITKDKKVQAPVAQPFRCSQCKIDFTPLWKWEKQGKTVNATFHNTPTGKDSKVICEQCVTTNVKKALKAEHTNRLKTAFVKALQQEQEIEQRLATQNSPSPVETHSYSSSPAVVSTPVPLTVHAVPVKSQTPTPRPTPPLPSKSSTPPTSSRSRQSQHSLQQQQLQQQMAQQHQHQAQQQQQEEQRRQQQQQHQAQQQQQQQQAQQAQQNAAAAAAQLSALANLGGLSSLGLGNLAGLANFGGLGLGNLAALGNLGNMGNLGNNANLGNALAMQALQQQLLRGLQGNSSSDNSLMHPALLYTYQLQMALGKNLNMNDLARIAEIQRQWMDMMPQQNQQSSSSNNSRQNNWKH